MAYIVTRQQDSLGLTIYGSNVKIPAHYHGCIVGATLALMGVVLLVAAVANLVPARAAARVIETIDKLLLHTELDAKPLYERLVETVEIRKELFQPVHAPDFAAQKTAKKVHDGHPVEFLRLRRERQMGLRERPQPVQDRAATRGEQESHESAQRSLHIRLLAHFALLGQHAHFGAHNGSQR